MPVSYDHKAANALEIQGVGRRFGGFWAVKDVSLTVRPGERRAVLGPNGAGKTTLFNVLTGDLVTSAGTIRMDGADVTQMPMHKRIKGGLRRTYQHAHLFNGLTVRDSLFLSVCGVAGGWQRFMPLRLNDGAVAKAETLAQLSGLSAELDREVANLSHGQRRQLEIGMALAENPKMLLLDEPAAGLSPSERPRLAELLLSLPKHITIILIEHDMDIALKTSDSVSVLHNGQLLAEGTPENIMSNEAVHKVYMGGAHGH
ncbi:ATP-binding cassette domain-containing protein [Rhodobacteraceae bacterium CY05]|uniref:ATP-binding cassette domain-containing protein n=1 Tax=Parasedimentitalea huanghaiensis TaxID=2682100 RepID=A0A6L6WQN6_9RHOB|nr:ATP-binding cassette domain-containing protein [Zongyanglinia huanghaiensis]